MYVSYNETYSELSRMLKRYSDTSREHQATSASALLAKAPAYASN